MRSLQLEPDLGGGANRGTCKLQLIEQLTNKLCIKN